MNSFTKFKFISNLFKKKTKNLLSTNLTSRVRYYSDSFNAVKSKVIVITGGNNLPTLNLAETFADAGAQAIILGTPPNEHFIQATNKLNQKHGEDKVIIEPCDLTKKSHVTNLFKIATKLFNKVDLVVNSADVDGPIDVTISTNINSVVLGTLIGFHFMGTNTGGMGGTIINISSLFGLDPFFGSPVYSGAKSFIIGFSRAMGTDYFYKLTNVKLLTICVGVTNINTVPSTNSVLPGFDSLNYDKIKHMDKKPVYKREQLNSCLNDMLKDGENGSVWIVEDKEYFKSKIPDWNNIKIPVDIC